MFDRFFQEAFEAAPVGMLVVDARGAVVGANRQLEQLFGYARGGLLGQPVEVLVDSPAMVHRAHREGFFERAEARPMGEGRDLYGRRRDGVRVPVEIGLTPLSTPQGTFVIASVVDLTERRRAQEALELSVREKDLLLRELQHRTKNNLQLIASLLDLTGGEVPDVVRDCRARINTIALVHEGLYQAGTFARLELSDYLRAVAGQFTGWTGGARDAVRVVIDAGELWLSLEHAVPCGLIVNELVTNSLKHAFPDGRAGTVTVRARREQQALQVEVGDDGAGGQVAPRPGHTGLDLVNALTRQLRGTLSLESGPGGTRARLTFPSVTP